MDMMESDAFAADILESISDYTGLKFERICLQYLYREAKKVLCRLSRVISENGGN